MSKKQNTLDLIKRDRRGRMRRHHRRPRVCGVCALSSACVFVCVRALACVSDLFPGRPRQGLWDASQHKKESVFIGAQANVPPRCFQAPWMTLFFSPHSGRSQWEEPEWPQPYKPKGQKWDKMWQAPELLPFNTSPLSVSASLPLHSAEKGEDKKRRERKRKKTSLQLASFLQSRWIPHNCNQSW